MKRAPCGALLFFTPIATHHIIGHLTANFVMFAQFNHHEPKTHRDV